MGRVGRSSVFGSKLAGAVVLFNDEDIKENAPGITEDMRKLLRGTSCLKAQLASYFGYECSSEFGWCCSSKECLSMYKAPEFEEVCDEAGLDI